MAGGWTQENQIGRLKTGLGEDVLLLISLEAVERLSESYTVTIEAVSEEPAGVHDLLGTAVGVHFESKDQTIARDFAGILWEYTELGKDSRGYRYRLVLRPPTEIMTLNRRNRIFQKQSVVDTIKPLLIGDVEMKLNATYDPVEYCVQYQESDFDFVSRLIEYEGIYYFYEHEGTAAKLVLLDQSNGHPDATPKTVKVQPPSDRHPGQPIWSVTERRGLAPTKVTVDDFDFETPATSLLAAQNAAKPAGEPAKGGKQQSKGPPSGWVGGAEVYDYPGKVIYSTDEPGAKGTRGPIAERYGKVWLDGHRRRMARSFADGELFSAATGRRLTLTHLSEEEEEYLIVGTSHSYVAPGYQSGEGEESFHCTLELMPADQQYRPALLTPRPRIMGPQTATVVGPAGEEIYTDKYGRIKVQFHWDREGKMDDKSSCFVRVMHSVAGNSWGSFWLPRIGQEVVITFMDGDPDRPLVTGAVYNADNTPPTQLPENMTQHGLRTQTTKGAGGENHYWFEDKKGSEHVWFRAERDYFANVVHADEERQYDEGNRKTTFQKGNDELIIDKGKRTETIELDDSKTIRKGNLTDIVKTGDEVHKVETGKRTTTIQQDETLQVKMGNRVATIDMGNDSLKVKMGNISTKADLGMITKEAMQSITLKVGQNSIVIDQTGVTIKGILVKIEGTAMLETTAPIAQHSGNGMMTIKGGIVMIN